MPKERKLTPPPPPAPSFLNKLTGTWYMTVPGPTPEDTFYAYHTYGEEGGMVETSSLLVALTEGPSHGVYERFGRGYILTFELFAFDPTRAFRLVAFASAALFA